MRILISGASGLVGTHLRQALTAAGHEVVRLVRRDVRDPAHEIAWNPAGNWIDQNALSTVRFDAVVHLSGKSIAGLWTEKHKQLIRSSRIRSSRLLTNSILQLAQLPKTVVGVSAIGYYGDRGDAILNDSATPGTGFMAGLCGEWEAEMDSLHSAGIRVVHPRLGVVLAKRGGFLAPLLPLFKLGLGAVPGNGRQWLSWIHIDDVANAILFALQQPQLIGSFNLTAPAPVTMRRFSRTLAKLLGRPLLLRIPSFPLRLLPGEMGQEMLLVSQRVVPGVLEDAGFTFRFAHLEEALTDVLAG